MEDHHDSSPRHPRSVIVVTGGGRGIGAATARLRAAQVRDPHHVIVTYRSDARSARKLCSQIANNHVSASAHRCDVSLPADVDALFAAADEAGVLVELVNNAGILEEQTEFVGIDRERWQRVFAVNVVGVADCCAHAVRRMTAPRATGRGGAIVNVSSRAAQLGSPGEYVDYASSKAALETLTRGLALEVADKGVRVNGVRPGIIDTGMHASGGDPNQAARLGPNLPMSRSGTAEEVAAAVCYLLSDAASYVTGAFLDVSGGR